MRLFCSICKEIFIPYSEVKVTHCGHLYHGNCISRWTKQHKTCPQCRCNLQNQPFRVYFDVEKDHEADPSTLEYQIEILSDKLRENEILNRNLLEERESSEKLLDNLRECIGNLKLKNQNMKTSVKGLKEQVSQLMKKNIELNGLKNELEILQSKILTFKKIEILLEGSSEEINKLLESTPVSELSVKQLCTYVGVLKTQFDKYEKKYLRLFQENKSLTRALEEEKKKYSNESEEMMAKLKTTNITLEKELYCMKKMVEECSKKHSGKENQSFSAKPQTQKSQRVPIYKLDIEFIEENLIEGKKVPKNKESSKQEEFSKKVSSWESLVSAGPSKNFNRSFNNSKFLKPNYAQDIPRKESNYAFDGLGGRKKIKLGIPTPREEFEKIKKKEDKRSSSSFKYKQILDYYKVD